jgi:predicted SAM-dependent methyltransferase
MKLHLGCGDKNIPGWINIDGINDNSDLKINISDMPQHFNNETIEEVYMCHVLEHFGRHEYMGVLKSIYDILKFDGVIRLSVPDFHVYAMYYCETLDINSLYGALYGGQKNEFDYHKWCFTFESLKNDLEKVGFKNIERYDWRDTSHANQFDWACDYLPRTDNNGNILSDEIWHKGTLASLNVIAKK